MQTPSTTLKRRHHMQDTNIQRHDPQTKTTNPTIETFPGHACDGPRRKTTSDCLARFPSLDPPDGATTRCRAVWVSNKLPKAPGRHWTLDEKSGEAHKNRERKYSQARATSTRDAPAAGTKENFDHEVPGGTHGTRQLLDDPCTLHMTYLLALDHDLLAVERHWNSTLRERAQTNITAFLSTHTR